MVTQGEYLGESFPEADHAASLEEGAHLLGEPLPLSVQEDAHTGLPTSPSSSHLCVIKIFNISKSLACLIWPIACATPTIERVWRVHVQSTQGDEKLCTSLTTPSSFCLFVSTLIDQLKQLCRLYWQRLRLLKGELLCFEEQSCSPRRYKISPNTGKLRW